MAISKVVVVDGNNLIVRIDRGVAGRGVTDVAPVEIDGSLYLVFTFSDGTTETVGPVGTVQYIGQSPIVVAGSTISLSTVPVAKGGTGQITANAGFNALAPTQTGNSGKYLKTDGTNSAWDLLDISTADITGTLPIVNGGTGQTTANASFNALAPAQTSNTGKYLKTDGTNTSWDLLDISTADITGTLAVTNGGTGATTASGARTNLNAADQSTTLTAGTGLSGGGDLSANRTFSITNTTVTAGSFGSASNTLTATVNAQGQLTALAATPIAIANTQITGLGTMSTQNANSVAITGGSITGITDLAVADGGTGASDASGARTNLGAAASAITISAGTGLSGGGDLSANRTLSITNTAVTAGAYGSASNTLTATVNAQGQLTALAATPIAIANTQVSGLGTMSTQNSNAVTITGGSITGITDLAIADGGTGASNAADARSNLGLGSAAVLNAGVALGVATLDAGGTVPLSQIPASIQGGVSYQGAWNASTNTPTLVSSVGSKGYYYVVSVAGNTNLNGVTDWLVGDWAIFNGTAWEKIDNTDQVASVNGYTGVVVLSNTDVGAPPTSLTISAGTGLSGGGSLAANRTLSIANTTVSAAPYGTASAVPTFTVNGQGQLTAASDVTIAIANTQVSGLGTMSTQNANSVAITGGTINGTTIGATTATTGAFTTLGGTTITASTKVATPFVDAVSSAGGALRNASGTSVIQWGVGGSTNSSVDGSINLNGTNAQIDISPTGTGHVHINPTGSGSVEINPTSAGTINNMAIGGTTPRAGAFTTLTASTAIGIASGGTGQATANAAFNALAPSQTGNSGKYLTTDGTDTSWASNPLGTVTSVAASVPSFLSIAGSPITTSGTLSISLSGTALPTTSGGTGLTSFTSGGVVYASSTSALATSLNLYFNGPSGLGVGGNATFAISGDGTGVSGLVVQNAKAALRITDTSGTNQNLDIGVGGGVATIGAYYSTLPTINYDAYSFHIFKIGGTEALRLTSSSLYTASGISIVVGASSPVLSAGGRGNVTINGSSTAIMALAVGGTAKGWVYHDNTNMEINAGSTGSLSLLTGGVNRLLIDASGNAGFGVTPSAWASPYKAFQGGAGGTIAFRTDYAMPEWFANAYYDGSYKYLVSGQYATRFFFDSTNGKYSWNTSTSTQTAGSDPVFSTLMTLNASGNFCVGDTSAISRLDVVANTPAYLYSPGQLNVRTSEAQGANKGAMISLAGYSNTTPAVYNFGIIGAYKENSTNLDYRSYMIFGTSDVYSNVIERMRISSDGFVGIYNNNPAYRLTVGGYSNDANNVLTGSQIVVGTTLGIRERGNTAGISGSVYATQIYQGNSGGGNLEIYNASPTYSLVFGTQTTERARITSDGNLLVGATAAETYSNGSFTQTSKLQVKGVANLGPASSGIVSSTDTSGGSLFRQTNWSGPATSLTIPYASIGAIDNSGGMIIATSTNKVSGAGGGVGTILLIWTKNSGNTVAVTTVSSLVTGAITTISASGSGNDLVITSNANSYFAWTSISAG